MANRISAAAYLYLNGKAISRNERRTPAEVLRTLPKGAYTSLRVEELRNVLDWNLHLQRLNNSVKLLAEKAPDTYPRIRQRGFRTEVRFPAKQLSIAEDCLIELGERDVEACSSGEEMTDLLVVILIVSSPDESKSVGDVYTYIRHTSEMGRNKEPIQVWVKGKGRILPEAKYSKWVTDRFPLEQQKPEGCQEAVLVNEKGGLLEGMTSSFYVIKRLHLSSEAETAGVEDGVLAGIYRHVLIDAIRQSSLQLSIHESCPVLAESQAWTEAFISNSLTGIRPIANLVVPGEEDVVFQSAPGEYTAKLLDLARHMHERTPISELAH